ncbi:MAG: hypothetical protein AB7F88_01580 [Pyrinomonadaceae bacterium]
MIPLPDATIEQMTSVDAKVLELASGKEIVKIIVVPKRLVNIVV